MSLEGGARLMLAVATAFALSVVLQLAAPSIALAADPVVGSAVTGYGVADWFGLLLRLALVLLAIWAAVAAMKWYVRRVNGESGGVSRQLQVLEMRSLGPNRSLQLVRLGGHAVLLGVTAERITSLLTIEDEDEVERLASSSASSRESRFAQVATGFGGFAVSSVRTLIAARRRAAAATPSSRASRRAPHPSEAPVLGAAADRARAAAAYGREGAVVAAQRAIAQARGEGA